MHNENNEHGKMKNELGNKLEYYYGFGMGRYGEVLDELKAHGHVNSCLTSALPLAEFWQPDNLRRIEAKVRPYLSRLDCTRALKFFEFPTEPTQDGRCIGRASMTDLMLMDGDLQIAIEAKFTEYSRMPNESVTEWLRHEDGNFFLRRRVARCWLRYIREARCTDLLHTALYGECGDVCYQFLHRTASACFKTNGPEGHRPVLIYQLFYNAADPVSREDRVAFEGELKKWAAMLHLRNMKFLIMSVPVLNVDEIQAKYSGMKDDLFARMKLHTIYKFDFDGIVVTEVV